MNKALAGFLGLIAALVLSPVGHAASPPEPGDPLVNFTLDTLDGKKVELQNLIGKTPVVLVVLRGWPGYQCPVCTKQVQDFTTHSADFAALNAQVLMIYPGPSESLQSHAREFLENKEWPPAFLLVTDPDYEVTNAYGLRWAEKNETAYPSTFIIGRDGKVIFAKVSHGHGDRLSAEAALGALRTAAR